MHGQGTSSRRHGRRSLLLLAAMLMIVGLLPAAASAQPAPFPAGNDARVGLGDGYDAPKATRGLTQTGYFDKQNSPFWDANSLSTNVGLAIASANSDMAFTGEHVLHGNWKGFSIYNVANPANPTLRTTAFCRGGQGDVTVHGNLMFTSVEETIGRVDCGAGGTLPANVPDANRMRGVRIWDISNLDSPVQVGVVQLCRGSHTHRLVEDPNDPSVVYIYNNGTSSQRHVDEAVHTPEGFRAGRCNQTDPAGPNPSQWMIEVIRVPLANPGAASVVREARLFANATTGAVNGLQNGPTQPTHPCAVDPMGNLCAPAGTGYSPNPNTTTCHDITAYPEIGLAAGACQGNGLLIDISNPANPVRLDAVADVNFAYWHSANFSNDGSKVMFTDEWGGGTGARCTANHRTSWGANALFTIDRSGATPKLVFESYYKLPVPQTVTENCVAHQANIMPVPNRDIIVQAWYQGGISMFDWTDPENPYEIGYFDRGPIRSDALVLGGHWSGYWYNGQVYGAEIARGLDVLDVTPTAHLSANEIAAAKSVQLSEHNAMSQRMYRWDASTVVSLAQLDQLVRAGGINQGLENKVRHALEMAEDWLTRDKQRRIAHTHLDRAIHLLLHQANVIDRNGNTKLGDPAGLRALAQTLMELRATYPGV